MKNKVFTEEVFRITMTKRVQYFVCFIRDHDLCDDIRSSDIESCIANKESKIVFHSSPMTRTDCFLI